MLRKLLKYEVKYSMKFLLPLNLVLILLGFIASLSLGYMRNDYLGIYSNSMPAIQMVTIGFIFLIYILAIILVGIVTAFSLVRRFYKNFFTDEGYLTFTLPVKASTLFLTKIINTFIWIIMYATSSIISITFFILNEFSFSKLWDSLIIGFNDLAGFVGVTPFVYGFLLIVLAFLSSLAGILLLYACFSLGYTLTKRKLFMSILLYIGVNIIINWISTLMSVLIMDEMARGFVTSVLYDSTVFLTLERILMHIGLSILQCIVCYFISHYCITKKLNLE
jgi:Predicted membrane protein